MTKNPNNYNLNLFHHASKELSTDAFLSWLFYFLDLEENKEKRQRFFSRLILRESDREKPVGNICVKRQASAGKGQVDLLVSFKLADQQCSVLFENKVSSTTSSEQLEKYRASYKDLYRYMFLKLDFVNEKEKGLCRDFGYEIIDAQELAHALIDLDSDHYLVEQYQAFLEDRFCKLLHRIKNNLVAHNDFAVLKEPGAQQYFISKLRKSVAEVIGNANDAQLEFKGTSGGGYGHNNLKLVAKEGEALLWRIDNLTSGVVLRFFHFSRAKTVEARAAVDLRRKQLREKIDEIMTTDLFSLTPDEISQSWADDKEILKLYFNTEQNSVSRMLQEVPQLIKEFYPWYNKNFD